MKKDGAYRPVLLYIAPLCFKGIFFQSPPTRFYGPTESLFTTIGTRLKLCLASGTYRREERLAVGFGNATAVVEPGKTAFKALAIPLAIFTRLEIHHLQRCPAQNTVRIAHSFG